ncbi:MAG: DUF4440 domain-containing protein [Gemmatimonadota bacterium]
MALGVLFVALAGGCDGADAPVTRRSEQPVDTVALAAPAEDTSGTASAAETVAEVREAFLASREALRSLDVEAFLEGYAEGPGLVVVDPTGEYRGRAAFESFVRAWFSAARRRSGTFGIVTAQEKVQPLDAETAAVVVHWSVTGAAAPYRSLLLYRRGADGWKIVAEHSAEVPREGPEAR